MRKTHLLTKILPALAVVGGSFAQTASVPERSRWESYARNSTILRDDWGIAHVYGKTDADAVFGAIYAQAEDDFNRVETNYINAMGRLAEAEGESRIYQDLRMKLFVDPTELRKQYQASPAWLRALMNAWADALNFYLYRHTEVHPRVFHHFEPWMALSFTEGSIGGDIERINLLQLEAFYGRTAPGQAALQNEPERFLEPGGSNGIAIAPSNTTAHQALLLINPHTSFFFRSELQMVSEEGLNAYGAATWGQFFIYQGFNASAGWMHTTSGVDAVDEYLESVQQKGSRFYYRYGTEDRPVVTKLIIVPYKTTRGVAEKKFTVYATHHGPIVREIEGKWVAIRLMQEPTKALMQSYTRTKATDYATYRATMDLQANSSNNTIFADSHGNIAYFHGNFVPRRDTHFDWKKPVDGSNPATDWKGLLSVEETPHLLNPQSGWLYNANNWPWSAAGPSSPKREDYPPYVENGTESARGLHAIRVLKSNKEFTPDSLISAAYDSYLPWFEEKIPALLKAYDAAPVAELADQIAVLRGWDYRWSTASVATSLAVFWGEELRRHPEQMLQSLSDASHRLQSDFGTWRTPWGDINRFQRAQPFDDAEPSIPVGFTSSFYGSLASFGARAYPGTKKWYGSSGNSFVAVVEFGDRVRAKAVSAGGESGSPASPHYNDQAKRYATGALREVYYYRDQLKGHTQREYHPGN